MFGLQMSLLRRATVARRYTFRSAFFCRATSARRLVPLWAMASCFRHQSLPWVRCFGVPRHSVAKFRCLCRFFFFFFGSPTGITVASCTGASSFWATSGFMSTEVGFFSSECASISWQAIIFTAISGLVSATISLWLASIFLSRLVAISFRQAFQSACLSASALFWWVLISSHMASAFSWPALISFSRSSIVCCDSIFFVCGVSVFEVGNQF